IDTQDSRNETPLHLAARRRFFLVVEFLLNEGADCTSLDGDGASALHKCFHAKGLGDTVETVQLLLEAGCSIDVRNSKGEAPVHLAAGRGFFSVIRLLLAWVADVTLVDTAGNSALHRCLITTSRHNEEACLQTVQLLVDAGCPVDLPNSLGETPLHLAASLGFDSMARILIDAGCDVNARNSEGKTPFHYAVLRNIHAVQFLLNSGACLPNDIITTVLSHPKQLIRHRSCFTSLLIHFDNPLFDTLSALVRHARALKQSDVFARDRKGQTPLHHLLRLRSREYLTLRQAQDVVRMFVECGCDYLLPDDAGFTPIELANQQGYDRIVNYLLDLGAELPGTNHIRA
ncbi:ankyrin repeat-containing domain protein, partial [Pisolithus marmoratus]